jgi:hypothetical protein
MPYALRGGPRYAASGEIITMVEAFGIYIE